MEKGIPDPADGAFPAFGPLPSLFPASRQHLDILILLSDLHLSSRCISVLSAGGFDVSADSVDSAVRLREALAAKRYDFAIAESSVPGRQRQDVLEQWRKSGIGVPLILLTDENGTEDLLRQGVEDYLSPGQLSRMALTARRVVEVRSLQEQVAHSDRLRRLAEQRYRSLFEQNLAGVYRITLDGRIIDLNQMCARMFGYSTCEEAKAHRLQEVVSNEADAQYLLRRLEEKKSIQNFELELRRERGQALWTLTSAALADLEPDSIPVAEGTLLDITRPKLVEGALRQHEQRFRALLDKSSDAISLVDAAGKVLYSSHAVSPILGYDLEDRIGKDVFELVHPADSPQALALFAKLVERPFSSVSTQLRYQHKDGSWQWIEAVATNLLEDPSVRGVVINYRSVTEQRRLQEQLFQAQKMEAVGRLAGGVAHDFNNLLTAILGYSDMVLEKLPRASSLRRYTTQIKRAGEQAAALTRQLLAFSRLQVLSPQVLDLNAVVSEMSRMLRRVMGEDIKLTVAAAPGLGRVKADPSQIEQVILNLAVNARDAMPGGGELTVRTSNEFVDESLAEEQVRVQPGAYVLLEVSDTGCGMDGETRARAFEPFFTTKERGKGTGLGLSTVYGIIKQSGGYIWVSSELGKGAIFKIYLPSVDEAVPSAQSAETPVHEQGGEETILLVEDENSVRALLRRVLRSRGYRVLEAKKGDEALAVCEKYRDAIHLILTDVVMPQMSGSALARRATELHPEAKLLYMTGYAGNKLGSVEVLGKGAQFVQKPFSAEALSLKIRSVLGSPENPGKEKRARA